MRLNQNGIDIFYIDESQDSSIHVVTAIRVPFLRQIEGQWTLVWQSHFEGARNWRRRGAASLDVPITKELHGVKLASGRGNYRKGKHSFERPKACAVYRRFLEAIDFLPDESIMSVAAFSTSALYGSTRLEAAMIALFQRMRTQCSFEKVNAFTFFDQGHPEYRKLYRKAQKVLFTGSALGTGSRNLPLDMFIKDANEKDSKYCYFTQLADLVAYSVFLKMKFERNTLEDWQSHVSAGNIYNSLPTKLLNIKASGRSPRDAIVRLT